MNDRMKAVGESVAELYSLLNALQFKVLFFSFIGICMHHLYVYTKIKNVCMFLLWAGGFSWRGKNEGQRGGGKLEVPVKPNLQTICTSSYKFHSRDLQVLGASLYMEHFPGDEA